MSYDLVLLLLVFAVAALSIPLTHYAARRSEAQPVSVDLKAEQTALAAVLRHPDLYPAVASLTCEDFAYGPHARLWAEVQTFFSDVPTAKDKKDARRLGYELQSRGDALLASLSDTSRTTATDVWDDNAPKSIAAAQTVLDLGYGRRTLPGRAPLDVDPERRPPIQRQPVTVGRLRIGVVSTAAALSAAAVASVQLPGTYSWLGTLSLAVLAAACLLVSLVDHDTLYLDLRSFVPALAVSWALAAAYCWSESRSGDALMALFGVVLVVVALEVIGWLYKLVRGQIGLGFGDQILLVGTLGVPAAILGQFGVPLLGLFASMLAFIIFGLGGILLRLATTQTPIAFVPFLSLGWILVLAVAATLGWTGLSTPEVLALALEHSGLNAVADAIADLVGHQS